MKELIRKNKLLLLLELISIVVHFRWFSINIFTFGDWPFRNKEWLQSLLNFSTWDSTSGLGGQDLTFWRLPYNLINGIVGLYGFNSNVSDKITVFIPIVLLTPLAAYLLVRKIVGTDLAGFIGGIIVVFNIYFLTITTQGHILLNLSFIFAFFAMYFLYKGMESIKYHWFLTTVLMNFICGFIDFRVFYILVFLEILIIAFEIITNKNQKINNFFSLKFLFYIISSSLALILLNLYWVLPFLKSNSILENDVLDRGLFGNQFWNLQSSITLFHPFWNGSQPDWFIVQSVPIYYWLLPIFAVLGFHYNRNTSKRVFLYFIISFAGVLLAKQVDHPFPDIYSWLFNHFPGFKAFREATKFYFLIVLGYSVLISYLIDYLYKKRETPYGYIKFTLVTACVLLVFLSNTLPILNASIKTLYIPKTEPLEYVDLSNFINSQKEYFRTMWVPRDSTWTSKSNLHPSISLAANQSKLLGSLLKIENDQRYNYENPDNIVSIFNMPYADDYLDSLSIKYVIVPSSESNSDYDFYKLYGGGREAFVKLLDQKKYLKKVDFKSDKIDIYENYNFKPPIYATPTHFTTPSDDVNNVFNLTKKLSEEGGFNIVKENKKNNNNSIVPAFEGIYADNDGKFIKNLQSDESSLSLINNSDNNKLYYSLIDNNLTIYTDDNSELLVDGTILNRENKKNIIYKEKFENENSYLLVNGTAYRISKGDKFLQYINSDSVITLYNENSENLVDDGGFENNNWQKEVGDCDNYDNDPKISMNLNNDLFTEGKTSLELLATRHTACIKKNIVFPKDGKVLLSFDYRGLNADNASFAMQFGENITKEVIAIQEDNQWYEFNKVIDINNNQSADFYLYAKSKNELDTSINFYDNIKIRYLSKVENITNNNKNSYELIKGQGIKQLAIKDFDINSQDLINNGDFTNGLWQKKVGDCNRFDNNGKVSMSLESGLDSNWMKLLAENHIACTNTSFPVMPNRRYRLTFKTKSSDSQSGAYYLSFQNEQSTKRYINFREKNTWQSETYDFESGSDSNSGNLYFLTENASYGLESMEVDNVSIKEIPNLQSKYFFVSDNILNNSSKNTAKESIKIIESLPFHKTIEANSLNFENNLNLVMNEYFNPNWNLQIIGKNGELSNIEKFIEHKQPVNKTNLWIIDIKSLCKEVGCDENKISLSIDYTPQRWMNIGLVISTITLIGLLSTIGILFYKDKKGKPSSDITKNGIFLALEYKPKADDDKVVSKKLNS